MNPSPAALEILDVFLAASTGALSAADKLTFAADVDALIAVDGVDFEEVRRLTIAYAAEPHGYGAFGNWARARRDHPIRAWWLGP